MHWAAWPTLAKVTAYVAASAATATVALEIWVAQTEWMPELPGVSGVGAVGGAIWLAKIGRDILRDYKEAATKDAAAAAEERAQLREENAQLRAELYRMARERNDDAQLD